jgi:hypothetical protein
MLNVDLHVLRDHKVVLRKNDQEKDFCEITYEEAFT